MSRRLRNRSDSEVLLSQLAGCRDRTTLPPPTLGVRPIRILGPTQVRDSRGGASASMWPGFGREADYVGLLSCGGS